MLSFEQIAKTYPEHLQGFQRNILREYLQYKILEAIFNSELSQKLCFIGGTALRIIHNTARFSEDIDFDNFNLSEKEFVGISLKIKRELELEGVEVEIKNIFKNAYHCHIKFPSLLFTTRLSPVKEEKILIQLDTESQGIFYQPKKIIINKFDIFTRVLVAPTDILLSQKIYAALNRKRAKGRDFYDIVFLFAKTKPNFDYLKNKLNIKNNKELKEAFLSQSQKLDFIALAKDVAPFLFYEKDQKKVLFFPEFLKSLD